MHSVQESYTESRVPDGFQFYSLQATMQAVTIVYLNRFLDEFLRYLSGLFFLCPPMPEHLKQLKRSQRGSQAGAATQGQPSNPGQPFAGRRESDSTDDASREAASPLAAAEASSAIAILLDVEMNAPVIEMPRYSTSADSLEVDLGVLKLTNSIVLLDTGQTVDVIDVTLQEVMFRCCNLCSRT
jgi:hypothetical protein